MSCARCGCKDTDVILRTEINGKVITKYICSSCALQLRELKLNKGEIDDPKSFRELFERKLSVGKPSSITESRICPRCGSSYQETSFFGKYGCSECYTTFAPWMSEAPRQIHKDCEYKGKCPDKTTDESIDKLVPVMPPLEDEPPYDASIVMMYYEEQFKKAVQEEDYTKAVRYKGWMRELREEQGWKTNDGE